MTEAAEKKRIVIRLDDEQWKQYDDKRHSERVSFQQLGEKLLRSWFNGKVDTEYADREGRVFAVEAKSGTGKAEAFIKAKHIDAVDKLVGILESGHENAIKAVLASLDGAYGIATAGLKPHEIERLQNAARHGRVDEEHRGAQERDPGAEGTVPKRVRKGRRGAA